jgi:hypothetical protein
MKEFLATYPYAVWSLVSVLLAAIVIMTLWQKVKWWWMNTWYSVPWIGQTARLARDTNRGSDNGWFKPERKLCQDYKKFIRLRDEHDFNEKIKYLTRAGDIGRSNTPFLIWVLTCALVFVEAMGFSYVLAGYTVPGASESTQQLGAIGIAFLVSVLLVAFTHFAGHELYVSGKIAQARRSWQDSDRQHELGAGDIALAQPQNVDDGQPSYVQLTNRVGAHAKYVVTICTAILVLMVAVGATYVRGKVMEKTLHQAVTGETAGLTLQGGGLSINITELPVEDAKTSADAQRQAKQEEDAIDTQGSWGTFIVLAFIFVFLQILGVLFGYKWGFAGKQSKKAYAAIGAGRYTSYADVRAHYSEISDAAQARLEDLQQRMMARNGSSGTRGVRTDKTFKDFLHEERQQDLKDRQSEREYADSRENITAAPTAVHVQTTVAVAAVAPAPAPAPVAQAVQAAPVVVEVAPVAAPAPAAPAPAAPAASADAELDALRAQLAAREAQVKAAQQAEAARVQVQAEQAKQDEIARLKAELAKLDGGASA